MCSRMYEYYSMGQLSYEVHRQARFFLFQNEFLITHMAYLRDIPTKAHRSCSTTRDWTFFLIHHLSGMGPYFNKNICTASRLLLHLQLCVRTLAGRIYKRVQHTQGIQWTCQTGPTEKSQTAFRLVIGYIFVVNSWKVTPVFLSFCAGAWCRMLLRYESFITVTV